MIQNRILATGLALSISALAGTTLAAGENETTARGRAAFPLVDEAEASKTTRPTPLAALAPKARAALPALPSSAPPVVPAPSRRPVAQAPDVQSWSRPSAGEWEWTSLGPPARQTRPAASPAPSDSAKDQPSSSERSVHDSWMLSLEAVTHAPVDAGFQLGLESPIGLRLFGGYGWMPGAYRNLTVGTAAQASDPALGALLDGGLETGRAWRLQAGIRPFRNVGVYLDAGYSRVTLSGTLEPSEITDVPELATMVGSYDVKTSLDMWLVELGYQTDIGGRIVLAIGLGAMGTLKANTEVTPSSGSLDPEIAKGASTLDRRLEKYGIVPTLTLRLGFDVI